MLRSVSCAVLAAAVPRGHGCSSADASGPAPPAVDRRPAQTPASSSTPCCRAARRAAGEPL